MNIPQPTLGLLGVFAILALHLCAVYTGLGAFALAWLSEVAGAAKKKVFLKKLSQQISALGILFLAYTLISAGGSFAVLHAKFPELIRPWMDNPIIAAPMLAALGWLLVFGLLHAFTWRMAKKSPGLHRILGLLAMLGVPAVLGVSLCMKLALYTKLPETVGNIDIEPMLMAGLAHPMFAPLTIHSVLLALACGAGFGLLYLVMRRNKDDFGRDYYNYAAKFTANTGILSTLGALASEAWVASQMLPSLMLETGPTLLGWLVAGGAAAAFLATIAWAVVVRSDNPLRRKPAMLLAALLLLLAVGGFSAANVSIFIAI